MQYISLHPQLLNVLWQWNRMTADLKTPLSSTKTGKVTTIVTPGSMICLSRSIFATSRDEEPLIWAGASPLFGKKIWVSCSPSKRGTTGTSIQANKLGTHISFRSPHLAGSLKPPKFSHWNMVGRPSGVSEISMDMWLTKMVKLKCINEKRCSPKISKT